jgi:hypothetical protein
MTMLMLMAMGARTLDAISLTPWPDITVSSPASTGSNADRALTWSQGGARNISASYGGNGTLQYRINSGAWTTYAGAFSHTSGETLGWQITTIFDNQSATDVVVTDATRGATIDTFSITASGFDA